MVNVTYRDEKFLIKGSIFIGMAGTFENKDYGVGNIFVESGLEDIIMDLEKDYYWMKPLKALLKNLPQDGQSIAKMYEDYLNGMEEKIKKNVKQLNNYFLYQLISNLYNCEYPFWEVEEAIRPQYRGVCTTEECLKTYSNEALTNALPTLYEEYDNVPLEGGTEKTDVEALIKQALPMFDLDALTASIKPDCLCVEGGILHVQFSDCWNSSFFCSAYVELDDTLTASGWDNF